MKSLGFPAKRKNRFAIFAKVFFPDHFATFLHFVRSRKMRNFREKENAKKIMRKYEDKKGSFFVILQNGRFFRLARQS